MERVVVTGVGLVTPNGIGTEASWQSLINGQSGVGPITLFDATDAYSTRIAAEVKNFDAAEFMERKKIKEVSRFTTFAMAATKMALDQAQLDLTEEERDRAGVFIGVGLGGLENLERCTLTLDKKGPGKVSPYFIPSLIANMAAGQVSIAFGFRGPSLAHTSACSSSGHAIGEALRMMQRGDAEVMIAGGAESTITPIGIAGFSAMFALSRRNDDPEGASRPWDKGRDGFVCGEGGGTLILETLTRAKKRGAKILAEVVGYAATSDAYHITKPAPDHAHAARAMRGALKDAKLNPEQIEYVNAHGTSTPIGDVEEARAVANTFGAHALDKKLWVSSTKSMMGHLLGAAGAVEGIVTVLALRDQVAPPTASFTGLDPQCGLDPVAGTGRPMVLDTALSNNFGFAGANATVAFARPGGPGAPAPAVGPDEVVVTGFGVITSAGEGAEALWEAYAAGRRQGVPEDGLRLARVEFDRSAAGSAKARRRMDRVSQLAVAACRAALGAAGADADADALAATGVVLGTGIGPMESSERFTVPVLSSGAQAANPAVFPATVYNGAAGQVAMALGTKGPTSTLTSGHAAGAAALGAAYDMLRAGRAERLLVPAVEAFSPGTLDAYRSIPLFGSAAGRRYTLAEAGIALVLERRASAERRGAPVHAVVLGHATASDACGIGRWDPSGDGMERAMREALRGAGLRPDQVSAVWANAAGLAAADRPEQAAVERVFDMSRVRFEAPKRVLGEPAGAGAHLSAVLAVGAWREGGAHRPVLVNSSSLGGTHTSLVLSPAPLQGTESGR